MLRYEQEEREMGVLVRKRRMVPWLKNISWSLGEEEEVERVLDSHGSAGDGASNMEHLGFLFLLLHYLELFLLVGVDLFIKKKLASSLA